MSRRVDLATGAGKSRWVYLADGADKSTTRADKSRWVELAARANKLDKSTCQNRLTQLPVDTSRLVDLATIADMSGCHLANTSRRVDLAPRTGLDGLTWLLEPTSL